ncbi:MAG: hypothetical protein ACNYNX_03170 [Leucobacter sp.]
MDTKKQLKKAAEATAWNPMRKLHDWGVRSSHAYSLGLLALGVCLVSSIFMSRESRRARVGAVLAPTLLVIGLGLKHEED